MDFVVSRRQMLKLSVATLATAGLAGCGGSSDAASGGTTDAAATDDVKQLTFEPGKLTVATGNPAWEPWVMNDDPASGEGFEAAVIYALAEKMGFAKEDVTWVRSEFDEAFAPGEHDWDMNIQQVSINEDRKKAIDFSPAYFRPTQAIIVKKDSKYAGAKSCAELKDAVFAVMMGTTAIDYVKDIIKGGSDEGVDIFNNNSDAVAAVDNGQADCLVTDTPQCVYMVESEQLKNGVVMGQIPGTEDPDGLGITLAKDSALTPFVTDAMNALLSDGTIDGLIEKWLASYTTDIPTLTK
ncbi:MAG: amino acid ABC transporter substrate-binding protein [Atopobiaceae bacterium]|nr:amino acid ABC transporter substrate-binding protein [Atopobiaceae bacterium]